MRTHDAPRVYGGDEETRAVSRDVLSGSSSVPGVVLSFCGEGHMCVDWVYTSVGVGILATKC